MNRETHEHDPVEPHEIEAFETEPRPMFSERATLTFVAVYLCLLFAYVLFKGV